MVRTRQENRSLAQRWKTLLDRIRDEFRIPENLNYYTEEDLRKAERCYISFRLGRSKRA